LKTQDSPENWREVGSQVIRTFAEARAVAPAILFIDEIDGIGKRQPAEREYADYWNGVVNKALELLDGAVKGEGLIVVGATNRPEQIDEALKRSGRLETQIEISRPDTATLAAIFRHHLGEDLKLLVAAGQETTKERPAIAELPSDTGGSLSQQTALKGGSK
jgi:SpoVK/Ycf46/Vps4 family AAA+-type ATPase